jgi:hypothetical protein
MNRLLERFDGDNVAAMKYALRMSEAATSQQLRDEYQQIALSLKDYEPEYL